MLKQLGKVDGCKDIRACSDLREWNHLKMLAQNAGKEEAGMEVCSGSWERGGRLRYILWLEGKGSNV